MDWLSKNWFWIALAIGVGFYLLRGRLGGPAGGHRGMPGGIGHGGHLGGDGDQREQADARETTNVPDAAIDPVGGEAVRTAQALTSLYQGNVYYFSSKENRDRFEAGPQEYAQKAVGHPIRPTQASEDRPRRRGGC